MSLGGDASQLEKVAPLCPLRTPPSKLMQPVFLAKAKV